MYERKTRRIRIALIYAASLMMAALGLGNLLVYLPFRSAAFRSIENKYSYLPVHAFALHRSFSVLIGFILIFISFKLVKRVKPAWILSMALVLLSLCLNLVRFHRPNIPAALEMVLLVLLFLLRGEFDRRSSPVSLKKGLFLAGASIVMVVSYTAAGLLLIKDRFGNIGGFCDSLLRSAQLLYMMDISALQPRSHVAFLFARSAVLLNWAVIVAALYFILNPLIVQPLINSHDREKVRALLKLYGDNPISYVDMEKDKRYFWGIAAPGVIAYTIAKNVMVCAGDPLCGQEDTLIFLSEFTAYCRKNDYQICFCQITERFVEAFRAMDFGISKYGEECMFDLHRYTLEGSAASRLRQGLRKAGRMGIRVFEYDPRAARDRELEQQITDVSNEWLAHKKSGELSFMLGTVSLDAPYDRRYFLAMDRGNVLQGFVVFSPFMGGRGYMADVTRRRDAAPFGVMEKLTVDAFMKMRGEGLEWGSLGLAPLYNVNISDYKGIVSKVFDYIYHNLNAFYGFKTLYQYKQKYAPTAWEPRYLAYYPKIMTPQIAYSLVKSQNPRGISDYLLTGLKKRISKKDSGKDRQGNGQ